MIHRQDTLDEMKEERISVTNPEAAERVMKHRQQQNPLAAAGRNHYGDLLSNPIFLTDGFTILLCLVASLFY